MNTQDANELRTLKGEDRERTFLTKMMDHHQSGIDMAKLALEKSQSPAIKHEAKTITSEQTKEIVEMRQHLVAKHRVNRTAKPDARMQPAMEKLQALSGKVFDETFAREMALHHQGAIAMAGVIVADGVPHAEIKALAKKTSEGNRRSQERLRVAAAR